MICIICKREFKGRDNRQICCSNDCFIAHRKLYEKEYHKKSEYKLYQKSHRNSPEGKAYSKAYRDLPEHKLVFKLQKQSPEYKAHKQAHRESLEGQATIKAYRESPHGKELKKAWQQSLKGKETDHIKHAQRKRHLGYYPLNDCFKNSHGHHINNIDVIFIPKELHVQYQGHSVLKKRKMLEINTAAFLFLFLIAIPRSSAAAGTDQCNKGTS